MLADGSDPTDVKRWDAERELAAAEAELAAGAAGARARLENAELRLDQLMHATLASAGYDLTASALPCPCALQCELHQPWSTSMTFSSAPGPVHALPSCSRLKPATHSQLHMLLC